MILSWENKGWEEYLYWQETDKYIVKRINELIKDSLRHPFSGIGKPEPLKENLKGYWSRRITDEHRLVYKVLGEFLIIAQCRYHY
jgi:toxin YoeB